MTPRYEVVPVSIGNVLTLYNLYDTVDHHPIGTAWYLSDAERIVNRLNVVNKPALRPLLAMELADFRMKLEHEQQGFLNDDPQIALLLADLCDFLNFNEGERALVLGRNMLIQLARLDDAPVELDEMDAPADVVYIQV
jgi:hypothetical protein